MKDDKKDSIKSDIEQLAINIVDTERTNWSNAVCFITEKVAFNMREAIRVFRKNFWGVFDEPTDPSTGRDKTWIHLVMSLVEDIVKNIDVDQKDIGFNARTPEGYEVTELIRAISKEYLSRMYFGEILDETERQLVIDGTVVWKTWEENGVMVRRTVDLLHCYIDPTEDNIQSAFRFTERGLSTPDEIAGMTGWMNTDGIKGSTTISRNDSENNLTANVPMTGSFVDVWECWGKIPKFLISGDKKDMTTMIDGHIIVSGLDAGDKRVHKIEENKRTDSLGNIIKPYEELRAVKITGRWYGLGWAERLLALQEYLNTIVNIRKNRSYVSQLGLFKIRKGQGITPQMLTRLSTNGAIPVNNMDDIQQFNIQPMDMTSYKDEETIIAWARQVTKATEISSGEPLPASTTATAAAIQNTNSKSAYTLVKEAIGLFLERWMDRHALPMIAKTIKKGDLIRIVGDDDRYKEICEHIAREKVFNDLKDNEEIYTKQGGIPTFEEVQAQIEDLANKLQKRSALFLNVVQDVVAKHVDTKVRVTNEDLDTSVTVQNLIQMMGIAPEYKEGLIKQIFDLLGLDMPKLPKPQMTQGAMGGSQGMEEQTTPTLSKLTQNAVANPEGQSAFNS